jgi:hypothetical protein
MALAILLSFALAPAILLLRRWRIARVPAVVVVMMLHCDSPAEGARPDRLRTKRGRTQAAPQPRDESVTATPRLSLGLTGWDLLRSWLPWSAGAVLGFIVPHFVSWLAARRTITNLRQCDVSLAAAGTSNRAIRWIGVLGNV